MQETFLWSILILFASTCLWKYVTGIIQQPRNVKRQAAVPRKLGLNQVYPDQSGNATRTEIEAVPLYTLSNRSNRSQHRCHPWLGDSLAENVGSMEEGR